MSFIRKRSRSGNGIDVSPMLDMVFILLIFFIVTSTFTRETGVDVTKPKASTAKELAKESILIGVTRQGTIHINETQVNLSTLQTVLRQMMAEAPDRLHEAEKKRHAEFVEVGRKKVQNLSAQNKALKAEIDSLNVELKKISAARGKTNSSIRFFEGKKTKYADSLAMVIDSLVPFFETDFPYRTDEAVKNICGRLYVCRDFGTVI